MDLRTTWAERGVVLAFAVVVAIVWSIVQSRQEKNRRKALQRVAADSGWDAPQYSEVQGTFEKLRGKETWTSNPIVRRDGSCVVFDYKFVRKPFGSARWAQDVVQTVVYVRSSRLDLPVISIEPLKFSDLSDKVYLEDAYAVRSPEPVGVETQRYLVKNSGIAIDGEANEIFVFRPGNLAAPNQILEYAKWGEGVARLFERPA